MMHNFIVQYYEDDINIVYVTYIKNVSIQDIKRKFKNILKIERCSGGADSLDIC